MVADLLPHTVHDVVVVDRGQPVGPWPDVHHLAVAQAQLAGRAFLVERRVAQPLQHPALVLGTLLDHVATEVRQHRRQQVGERHLGRHGDVRGLLTEDET